jgi:signal transduction histidine kinase
MTEDRAGNRQLDEAQLDDIAHDLNNLLTVIRSRAQLILECDPVSTDVTESLNHILIASDRAVALTHQLTTARCPA